MQVGYTLILIHPFQKQWSLAPLLPLNIIQALSHRINEPSNQSQLKIQNSKYFIEQYTTAYIKTRQGWNPVAIFTS